MADISESRLHELEGRMRVVTYYNRSARVIDVPVEDLRALLREVRQHRKQPVDVSCADNERERY